MGSRLPALLWHHAGKGKVRIGFYWTNETRCSWCNQSINQSENLQLIWILKIIIVFAEINAPDAWFPAAIKQIPKFITSHRFCVLPPFEKWLFLVGVYFGKYDIESSPVVLIGPAWQPARSAADESGNSAWRIPAPAASVGVSWRMSALSAAFRYIPLEYDAQSPFHPLGPPWYPRCSLQNLTESDFMVRIL